MNTVNEHISLVPMSIVDKVNHSIEKALYILILRIFEEKCQVIIFFLSNFFFTWPLPLFHNFYFFKPIIAVISRTVYNVRDIVLFEDFFIFGNFLSRKIQTFNDLRAVIFELLHFQLMSFCISHIKFIISFMLFHLLIRHFFIRL